MIYVDTGCLLKLYYPEPESARVAALVAGSPICFIALHELELTNALELKLFRGEATARKVRSTASLVQADLAAGVLFRPPVEWDEVLRQATSLARAHSRALGCRSLDILHCAAAQRLAATSFVTTDQRQRRLARRLGMRTPAV